MPPRFFFRISRIRTLTLTSASVPHVTKTAEPAAVT